MGVCAGLDDDEQSDEGGGEGSEPESSEADDGSDGEAGSETGSEAGSEVGCQAAAQCHPGRALWSQSEHFRRFSKLEIVSQKSPVIS